jgi:archaellum biogenesis ATPase FlaH
MGLQQVDRVLELRPRTLLVEFNINDSDLRRRLWLWESRDNILAIANKLKSLSPNTKIVLMTMSPAWGLRALLRPLRGWYDDNYRKMASENGFELIDVARRWEALSANELRDAIPDGVHPTREAFLAVAFPEIARSVSRLPVD